MGSVTGDSHMATKTPDTSYLSLLAASNLIGKECADVNTKFIQCKLGDENPAKCVSEGEKVTACTLKVLRVAEKNCLEKLNTYKSCLKKYNRSLGNCREQQSAFEECWNSIDG